MVISQLKFENAPAWAPEDAMNLVHKGNSVFEFVGPNYKTTYTFSNNWKTCTIVNQNNNKKAKRFEFNNVKVDKIEFAEGE